jgi:predicted dehydrogenase
MSRDKLRFGLVGAGRIAQAYAQALEDCETARIVAVADIRADAARALAEGLECPSYNSHRSMANKSKLDAVIVCSPPVTHSEICLYFLQRKIHVMAEKPFSLDVKSARTMIEAADRAGVKLTMASKFRYVEDVIRAKSIVTAGILGEIILFENSFTSLVDMSSRWNADPKISGGGVLIDNGCHSVDLMRYFLGPVAEVRALEGKRVQKLQVEDTVQIFVRSAKGAMGNIDLSWSINKEMESYLNIYGSNGTVSVGWKQSKYRQSSSRDWIVFGKGYDKVEALRRQVSNFAKSILGQEMLLITPDAALASVEVIQAAYHSLQREHWINVDRCVNGRSNSKPKINGRVPAQAS